MKIKNKIKCIKNGVEVEIDEINISKENFTPKSILDSEREFLLTGGIFPQGDMENSRGYLGYVAAKMINCSYDDLVEKLTGREYLEVTNEVKGLFNGVGLESLAAKILENQF
ncbi:hypothetical protein [Fusobacterium polymorphum]|uniref:hypothetical protein n=1 Tax=Fusobacterium nucleatum subsp. polymorphum TaxID=76857 RepID=UPI0030090C27